MRRLSITCNVPHDVAILSSYPYVGIEEFTPTAEQLQELEPEDRSHLAKRSTEDHFFTINKAPVTWEILKEAIIRDLKQEHTDRVAKFEAYKIPHEMEPMSSAAFEKFLYEMFGKDVVEDVMRKEYLMEEMQEKYNKKVRENKEKREEEDRQKKANEQFKKFALHKERPSNIQRSAEEGYDIRTAVLDIVLKSIAGESGVIIKENSHDWNKADWTKRACPSTAAFALADIVANHSDCIKKPDCIEVTFPVIVRAKINSKQNQELVWKTHIMVLVASPITTTRAIFWMVEEAPK